MKKKPFYEPDYHLLNREAKEHKTRPEQKQNGSLVGRLLSNHKPEPVPNDPELFQDISKLIKEIKKQVDWNQDLLEASFVAIDTETTGLRPFKGDEIISIGAVILEKGKIHDHPVFYRLVNPRKAVPPRASEITGLDDEMLQDKPQIMPVLKEFLEFCGPRIIVAHNAPFDLAFLNLKLGEAIGSRIFNPVIDTALLTSALFYHLEDFSLEHLSSRFGFSLKGRHNALTDACIAATLFMKLLPELQNRGIKTLPHLAGLFSGLDPARGYPLIF